MDVCICTHNPRLDVFQLVLAALGRQTLARESFQVWVIDNGSHPPLGHDNLAPLARAGVRYSIVREEKLGNVHARERAIRSTQAEWIVFVDDDNELADDYLAGVRDILQTNPQFGCFGGKLLLASPVAPPCWMKPLLPYLAIKDEGDEVISNCADHWGPWEPPTAGAAVKRPVLDLYLANLASRQGLAKLGRKGKTGLLSGEDSLMMRGAFALGLHCSYQPRLILKHHLDSSRFALGYMLKLCYGYGRSRVILDRCLGKTVKPPDLLDLLKFCSRIPATRKRLCKQAVEWGRLVESRATD